MPKVVVNRCFGGYGLSPEAYKELGLEWDNYGHAFDDDRTNPKLVQVVERLGKAASGKLANLVVIEVPEGVEFEIDNYDGQETAHEKHRSW